MGNIPLVALDVRTQQPSPLQEFSTLQQIMGARQDQQLREQQIQGAHRKISFANCRSKISKRCWLPRQKILIGHSRTLSTSGFRTLSKTV